MIKRKNITLLSALLSTSVAMAAPNISAGADPYFNGADGVAQKDIIVKPIQLDLDAPAWVAMNYRTGDVVSEKAMNIKENLQV